MKIKSTFKSICFLLVLFGSLTSCGGQNKTNTRLIEEKDKTSLVVIGSQISEYIRNIYQDKNGSFWFGTNGYGVARYDGNEVSYYSVDQGFNGYQVTGIAGDAVGNIWFATDQGVVKCILTETKEIEFVNYTDPSYFNGQRFWSIYSDSKNNIWAGSATSIYVFDGLFWVPYSIPYPEKIEGSFISKATTWSIIEDSKGHMWFSTNGFGVYKFDGESFTQYSKEDGLTDNDVDVILEDSKGSMWFGTRFGGVSKYEKGEFINYTSKDSIGNDEVCALFEDSNGNIWMSSEGFGVYRFDGASFTNYSLNEGLGVKAVQAIFEDKEGNIWVGGGGGLFRFDNERFVNIKRNGPWEHDKR